jgi:osmotically-inducible protein OsmY
VAKELPEEEELKFSRKNESGSGRTILVLALLVFLVGAAYFITTRNSSVQNAFPSIKESTQDAATTSRVRTALLLSKHVSPFDIKVQTIQGEVTLEGQVPSEQVKTVAGAIAQDTSSVKLVHNNLGVNPAIERNADREHLGKRVADLEIQTLVTDALSKNADLAEKHIATQVKNRTVALTGTVQIRNTPPSKSHGRFPASRASRTISASPTLRPLQRVLTINSRAAWSLNFTPQRLCL